MRKGKRITTAVQQAKTAHLTQCAVCGQLFDEQDLKQVLDHVLCKKSETPKS
jgi:formylmethanofuran dehydrogenase subunit E